MSPSSEAVQQRLPRSLVQPTSGESYQRELGGQKRKHHRCLLGPVQVVSLERVSEHQLNPGSALHVRQESQGDGEGKKINLKGGEGYQYNKTFNQAQIKAHQSLPSLPFLPWGVQNQQRAGKVLLEEESECNTVQAGCYTHTPSSPELTQTKLSHTFKLQSHIDRPSPTRPCAGSTVGCTQSDAARSRYPGGGGEAGRQLEIYNHQERSERSSLTLLFAPSVSDSASSPNIHSFLSDSAPLNGRVTFPVMHSPADPLAQRDHSFFSTLFHILCLSLQLLQD